MTTKPTPVRGEVWRIRFDPAEGDEIKKVHLDKWGELIANQLDDIANAIAVCVGAP